MSSEFHFYNKFFEYINGDIDLNNDVIKLMLVKTSYVPDVTHKVLADIVPASNELAEVDSPANGYVTGGQVLTGQSYVSQDSPALGKFVADNMEWPALTGVFRYGVLYAIKTVSVSPAIVNPLIGYILFDNTPADKVLVAIDFWVLWNVNGIFDLSVSA